MSKPKLKVGDKIECLGVVGHPYLAFEAFRGATGTIIKKGDESWKR